MGRILTEASFDHRTFRYFVQVEVGVGSGVRVGAWALVQRRCISPLKNGKICKERSVKTFSTTTTLSRTCCSICFAEVLGNTPWYAASLRSSTLSSIFVFSFSTTDVSKPRPTYTRLIASQLI